MARVYLSRLNNIFSNLAFEDRLFELGTSPALFLYRNEKTIVIGRNQNPWKECYVERMQTDGVQLCRRKSGGGAVYQDLGNSVFGFVTSGQAGEDFKQRNNVMLVRALERMGVRAEVSGRNDLTLDGRKISGSAYKLNLRMNKLLSLHHGTMLFSVDKEGLQKYLNPSKAKLLSKGVQSVAARVVNISELYPELDHDKWCSAMIATFTEANAGAVVHYVDKLDRETEEIAGKYLDWEWRFGSSPAFSHSLEKRFDWGTIDLNMQVEAGVVIEAKVFSDSLYPDFIDRLNAAFVGLKYGPEGLVDLRLRLQDCTEAPLPQYVEDVACWLHSAM
jgi:lipoate-protein ligase A